MRSVTPEPGRTWASRASGLALCPFLQNLPPASDSANKARYLRIEEREVEATGC